jgi:hypothetical protein
MSELIDNRAWRLGIQKGIIKDLHAEGRRSPAFGID